MLLSLRNCAEQLSLNSGPSGFYEDISELFSLVHQKLTRFRNLVEKSLDEGDLARETTLSTVSLIHYGTLGRPSFLISRSQLEAFMELGFSNSTIARMLCISERTLRQQRAELGLPVGRSMLYSSISDEELDEIVSDIMQVYHFCACNSWLSCVYRICVTLQHLKSFTFHNVPYNMEDTNASRSSFTHH